VFGEVTNGPDPSFIIPFAGKNETFSVEKPLTSPRAQYSIGPACDCQGLDGVAKGFL
jgi:hypothetical protein